MDELLPQNSRKNKKKADAYTPAFKNNFLKFIF